MRNHDNSHTPAEVEMSELSPKVADCVSQLQALMSRFRRMPNIAPERQPFKCTKTKCALTVIYPDLTDERHIAGMNDLFGKLIARDRVLQLRCRRHLEAAGVIDVIEQSAAERDNDSFTPDYVDLTLLYEAVKIVRPRHVLELGSGLSTLTMAKALDELDEGARLTAIEPSAHWAENTERTLPVHLAARVAVLRGESGACEVAGKPSKVFTNPVDAIPDFIYVDGAPEGARFMGMETVIALENQLPVGTVIAIDARQRAFGVLLGGGPLKRKYGVMSQGLFVHLPLSTDPHFIGPVWGLDRYFTTFAVLIE
jgi:predicted O-methyltransferase YrrM